MVELQFRGNWGNLRTKTNFRKFNETREMKFSPLWGHCKTRGSKSCTAVKEVDIKESCFVALENFT